MKLEVKQTFRDKNDHVTVYHPGDTLDVEDKARAADLVKRGLCVKVPTLENTETKQKNE